MTLNTREFSAAIRQLARKLPQEKLPQLLNQAALDVAGEAFDAIPPASGAVDSTRLKLRRFLREQLSTTIKLATSGKRKGSLIRRGGRAKQLIRANLLANYWRGRAGKPGLYGAAMRKYTGKLTGARTRGVGFIKSVFLPIIRGLNPLVKYKFPFNKTAKIARWPGSKGFGIATPARPSWNPVATFEIRNDIRNSQAGKVQNLYFRVVQAAIDFKAAKLQRQFERELQAEFNKVNAR